AGLHGQVLVLLVVRVVNVELVRTAHAVDAQPGANAIDLAAGGQADEEQVGAHAAVDRRIGLMGEAVDVDRVAVLAGVDDELGKLTVADAAAGAEEVVAGASADRLIGDG